MTSLNKTSRYNNSRWSRLHTNEHKTQTHTLVPASSRNLIPEKYSGPTLFYHRLCRTHSHPPEIEWTFCVRRRNCVCRCIQHKPHMMRRGERTHKRACCCPVSISPFAPLEMQCIQKWLQHLSAQWGGGGGGNQCTCKSACSLNSSFIWNLEYLAVFWMIWILPLCTPH